MVVKLKLEVYSWLTRAFGPQETGHIEKELEVQNGTTVRVLFDDLASGSAEFAEWVFDREKQNLTGRVSVFFNERVLELVDGLDTEIQDGDRVLLLPAYAGGGLRPRKTDFQAG